MGALRDGLERGSLWWFIYHEILHLHQLHHHRCLYPHPRPPSGPQASAGSVCPPQAPLALRGGRSPHLSCDQIRYIAMYHFAFLGAKQKDNGGEESKRRRAPLQSVDCGAVSGETVHFQHSESVSSFNGDESIGDPQVGFHHAHPTEEGKAADSLDGNHGNYPKVTETPADPVSRQSLRDHRSSTHPPSLLRSHTECHMRGVKFPLKVLFLMQWSSCFWTMPSFSMKKKL